MEFKTYIAQFWLYLFATGSKLFTVRLLVARRRRRLKSPFHNYNVYLCLITFIDEHPPLNFHVLANPYTEWLRRKDQYFGMRQYLWIKNIKT
jgi:hypothetical protein